MPLIKHGVIKKKRRYYNVLIYQVPLIHSDELLIPNPPQEYTHSAEKFNNNVEDPLQPINLTGFLSRCAQWIITQLIKTNYVIS